MKKIVLVCALASLSACGCRCRYNEYIPENNPLAVPAELRTGRTAVPTADTATEIK